MKYINFSCRLLIGLLLGSIAIADTAVIVNPSNPINEASLEDIGNLFLKKVKKIKNQSLTPFDQSESSPSYAAFHKSTSKKTPQQMKSYWANKIFTGKGSPPETLRNDRKVMQLVSGQTDAIGYVDANAVDNSVKVIARIPK